ncbi:biotin--[acetyl-CoA-carboxylase] ligase [Paenibacillus sp. CAA11]|uniref:biotin--[acetyl-CoA-carboxylase] ligase n=1 Tax=Paenibacillus sp. CAA11 TaxID=1532905 RepID=UPI000D35BF4A|nr:biotin--[acetyl-CoA-carboxylase] ligase [Paenibacillus sp. CAA11]AWB44982.1 biotin--[acetyl-CoA-carboxylase] ligase [Paenibacillus sp. CAA11]
MNNHSEELLKLFRSAPGEYISGEEISRKLQISRTAVWKHINKLREVGYSFEAVSRKGYLMTGVPDRLDPASLLGSLQTKRLGRALKVVEITGSTQEEARMLADQGASEGALVIAEEQTAGRGRMGRKWFSPPGKGLWMSVLLRPSLPLTAAPQLTLLTAVAVCQAIRTVAGVDAGIKWPNDILIQGRKTCGILLESVTEEERIRYCIAGIGIDVNVTQDELPADLQEIMTSLKIAAGKSMDRAVLAGTVMNELEGLYDLYLAEGFRPIAHLWEALSVSINRTLIVNTPRGEVKGQAVSLDESGALILLDEQGERFTIFSGDIRLDR